MELIHHTKICQNAVGQHFSPRAMETIIAANHRIDGLFTGLLGHPEYHFDDNKIDESRGYIKDQHSVIRSILDEKKETEIAWKAFGRLLHVVQDFYSHSNYVKLWLEKYSPDQFPPIERIDGIDETLLNHKDLHTTVVYYPLEALTYFPFMRPLLRPLLPKDSHANMNLDSEVMGPLFPYAAEAARQGSILEYEKIVNSLNKIQLSRFQDKKI